MTGEQARREALMDNHPFWQGKKVFVTGATGLLGSWLTDELVRRRASTVALVRDIVPDSLFFLPGCQTRSILVAGCVEDYPVIERALNEYEIDTVFHLGAQTIVPTANRSPLSTFEANIKGTWTVLEACRRSPLVERIVVASSDKAYGSQNTLPYTEEMPLRGEHPYDVSKSCADLLAQSYFKTYALPLAISRCGNIFGGGDLNFNRLVPGVIKSLLQKEPPLIRSDGTPTRDYFYVKDAVSACLRLGERLESEEVRGQAFNFSNERPLSVMELVRKIGDLIGVHLDPVILKTDRGEIRNQALSNKKAREVLGWEAEYSLERGLTETIAWYRSYLRRGTTPDR
jgi:CDP-glucose 4,6-dehydratase